MVTRDDIRQFGTVAMDRHSVPGAVIGISTDQGREIVSLGVTALDTEFPTRPDTLFQIGSITKPMTATLLVALCESGELDLDEPILSYLPDFQLASQSAAESITLRHLLSHQAGFWGDWFDDFGLADDAIFRFVAEYHRLPQLFAPGSMWAYNNCGYILSGLVAAIVTGDTFEASLKATVFDPLGMDHSVLSAAEAIAYPVAVGHTNDPRDGSARIARQFLRPRARNPAGGVLASIEDVLAFAEFHLGTSDGPLSDAARLAMQHRLVRTFETDTYWGLGFAIEEIGGRSVVGHGGATNGFRAQLAMVPDAGFAVAVLTNSDSGDRFTKEIVDQVLDQRLGIRRVDHPSIDLPTERADDFAGTFRQPYATIRITRQNASLAGRVMTHSPYSENPEPIQGEPFELDYIGDERFVARDGEFAGFQLKYWTHEDGTVRFLQTGGRLYVPGDWDAQEGAAI